MARTTKFKLTLIGHYWDLIPEYTVYCNEKQICRREIPTDTGVPYTEEFEFTGDAPYVVKVVFENKTNDQSVLNLNRDKLVRDMLLEVQALTVNDCAVSVTENSVYQFDQKQMYAGELTKRVSHVNVMGFNGTLTISIP